MCIIVIKPKKVDLPTRATLKTCFDNNSDGAGFMFYDRQKNDVVIKKGFMSFRKFYKEVKLILQHYGDVPLIMHFRISTSGGINQGNTHPYPISYDQDDLTILNIRTNLGMCHNGVLSNYDFKTSKLCDTQHFIQDFVFPLWELNPNFLSFEKTIDLLNDNIGFSKLAFLDNTGKISTVGNFITVDGILYSNDTYKSNPYTYYQTLNNQIKSYTYPDEIDYFNFKLLKKGWYIESQYNNYELIDSDNKYILDSGGNVCTSVNKEPGHIVYRKAKVYDENYEEVLI